MLTPKMTERTEEEYTQLSIQSLLDDAKKFGRNRDREFRANLINNGVSTSPNTQFLSKLLLNNKSHNDRVEKALKDAKEKERNDSDVSETVIELSDSDSDEVVFVQEKKSNYVDGAQKRKLSDSQCDDDLLAKNAKL